MHAGRRRRLVPAIAAAVAAVVLALAQPHAQTLDTERILARWDSLRVISIPKTAPIVVEGEEITVREIVERAAEGERTKLEGYRSVTFTSSLRAILEYDKKKRVNETVFRVYSDKDGYKRRVFLAESRTEYERDGDDWVLDEDAEPEEPNVRVETGGQSEFTDIPFYLEDTNEFDFQLVNRTLEDDHVIFEIAFRPKSEFKPLPYGIVFITTAGYRVVHEVYHFARNPLPLFLKNMKRISRQWVQLPSGHWVFTKVRAEIDVVDYPFDVAPKSIAVVLTRNEFRFDEPYDERLFGPLDGPQETGVAGRGPAIHTDSLDATGLLASLQSTDDAHYRDDLVDVDPAFVNTAVAQHDSFGLEGIESAQPRYGPEFHLSYNLSERLSTYNRVEGLVVGLKGRVQWGWRSGPALTGHGAYATASREFRYLAELSIPFLRRGETTLGLETEFGDHVVPFGTNLIPLNAVRAVVAGADEQDYLRRRGGFAGLALRRPGLVARAGFDGARETSVGAETDFSVFGEPDSPNPGIEEGDDFGVLADLEWNHRDRLTIRLAQRLAGGALGGDFRYSRTDFLFRIRRFLVGTHEVELTTRAIATEDSPPVHRLVDIGGLMTVRGYDRRTLIGEYGGSVRLEYLLPYDLFYHTRFPLLWKWELQFVPWADAGRVGDGNSQEWIHSAGFGIQRYLGPFGKAANLRLDFAWPTSDLRQDDFRVFLHFTAQAF